MTTQFSSCGGPEFPEHIYSQIKIPALIPEEPEIPISTMYCMSCHSDMHTEVGFKHRVYHDRPLVLVVNDLSDDRSDAGTSLGKCLLLFNVVIIVTYM